MGQHPTAIDHYEAAQQFVFLGSEYLSSHIEIRLVTYEIHAYRAVDQFRFARLFNGSLTQIGLDPRHLAYRY